MRLIRRAAAANAAAMSKPRGGGALIGFPVARRCTGQGQPGAKRIDKHRGKLFRPRRRRDTHGCLGHDGDNLNANEHRGVDLLAEFWDDRTTLATVTNVSTFRVRCECQWRWIATPPPKPTALLWAFFNWYPGIGAHARPGIRQKKARENISRGGQNTACFVARFA